jgi:hypothetical protein
MSMTKEEIRLQVEADWKGLLDALRGVRDQLFLEAAAEHQGAHFPLKGTVALPNFGDLTPHFRLDRFAEIVGADLAPKVQRALIEIVGADMDQILAKNGELAVVEFIRQGFLKNLKRALKTIPSHRETLKGVATQSSMPLPRPLAVSLVSALSALEDTEALARAYIDFLEEPEQLPALPVYTARGTRRKNVTDLSFWQPVLAALAELLRPRCKNLARTCETVARVMQAAFPSTWGQEPLVLLAKRIKNRLH